MHCTECGKEANQQAKFCSECGNDLKTLRNVNIESGDNSVNFGQQNQVTGNTININSNEDVTDKAYIDRTKVRPLSIAGSGSILHDPEKSLVSANVDIPRDKSNSLYLIIPDFFDSRTLQAEALILWHFGGNFHAHSFS